MTIQNPPGNNSNHALQQQPGTLYQNFLSFHCQGVVSKVSPGNFGPPKNKTLKLLPLLYPHPLGLDGTALRRELCIPWSCPICSAQVHRVAKSARTLRIPLVPFSGHIAASNYALLQARMDAVVNAYSAASEEAVAAAKCVIGAHDLWGPIALGPGICCRFPSKM